MSDLKDKTSVDSQVQGIFAKVKETAIEPTPYLKTRVLAHLREQRSEKKQVRLWKTLFASSLVAMAFMGFYTVNLNEKLEKVHGVTNQAYVIHVDFNQNDLQQVARAEVVLPDDVHFVSSKGKIQQQRKLNLPIDIKAAGRGKLPFVVASNAKGEKEILVRLLDEENHLVREQLLKFKFAKTDVVKEQL